MTADEQAIRDVQRRWLEASIAGDLPRVLSLMTDDVVFLVAGQPPFGKEQYAANYRAGQGKMSVSGGGTFEEVVVVGEVAYARGKLDLTLTPTGGAPRRMSGYTLTVFRKQADGRWLLARDANLLTPVAT